VEPDINAGEPLGSFPSAYTRRSFLRRGLYGAAGVGLLSASGGLLAACGSSTKSSTPAATTPANAASSSGTSGSTAAPAPGSLGSVTAQLQWIENFNWAGMYMALDKGYYHEAGLSSVKLLPGGPAVVPETIVLAGKANFGFSSADAIASAILAGAGFKIYATQYQENPFGIMSLADKPIDSPKDMIGKKIGLSAENKPELDAFLSLNGIKPSQITMVPVGFNPVSAFASHQIDGCLAFVENPLELEVAGYKPHFFLLADYGYNIISDSYFALESTLASDRAKLKAQLIGDIKGWSAQVADPAAGAQLGVATYGKQNGLVLSQEIASAKIQNTIVATAGTKTNGILSISPALQDQNIKSLAAAGIKMTAAKLFDTSLIDEIYTEYPSLKGTAA
jgi:ABC-type nitrate/sulfonate/bicarbonate transport system substrate-binding protein